MAYIAPDSTIRFHKNIVLDNTYDHTYYFDSITAQNNFFSDKSIETGKVLFELDNYSYQRHTSNSIRIARPASAVMNCSYISFKNSSFENKWFYAFLTDYEYVNNSTTIIYYEIDVMQTFMFDIEWKQCYIERQHTISDNIGENTIEENLPIGEYIYQDAVEYGVHSPSMVNGIDGNYQNYSIVVAATFTGTYDGTDWTFYNATGGLYGGCYSGVKLTVFSGDSSGVASLNSFLLAAANVAGLTEGLISVFMIPTVFTRLELDSSPSMFTTQVQKYTNWTFNDTNYSPKNNKIYTAPYTMLHIDNSDGKSADFGFEYFSTPYVEFLNMGIAMPISEISIIPRYHKGLTNDFNSKISINNYPQCAYATDSYRAWLAMNSDKLDLEMGAAVVRGLTGFIGVSQSSGGASGAIQNAVNAAETVGNVLIEKKLASTKPPHSQGQNTGVLNVANKQFGFHFYYCRPKDEYAHMIDDYFTRYGYAIHQNAVPNLCARTRFTYVKTVDCTIEAEIANEYTQKIVSIMNNGITFWNDKTSIGNYESPNTIISG
jgi:hypothetical protein